MISNINTTSSLLPPDTQLRALQDKSLEKRKAAAAELQREIEQLVNSNNSAGIEDKIKQFDMCTTDENTTKKRAGLYGISVITVVIYQKVCKSIHCNSLYRNLNNT
jgi:hypothetical protein